MKVVKILSKFKNTVLWHVILTKLIYPFYKIIWRNIINSEGKYLFSKFKKGNEKNNIIAFDTGYIKSKTAIIDANITTLLAAIILFFMGSGPVKGFAVTLGVGIFTTLFSVYFIARLFTSLYVTKNKNNGNSLII